MNTVIRILLVCLLLIGSQIPLQATAAEKSAPLVRVRGKVLFASSMNLYGILSEDNKKYHPIKKLPNKWLKDGLQVVVEGKIRDDLVGSQMWGQPFEVIKITDAAQYVSWEDKEAIRLFLLRMDAFNTKDLAKLQSIDVLARGLTPEQFNSWIFDNANYTLHYIETEDSITDSTINGLCLYSRQHTSSMSLSGKTNYAVITFTLSKIGGGWKFTDTTTYVPDDNVDMDQFIEALMTRAVEKYSTNNLAKWKGK